MFATRENRTLISLITGRPFKMPEYTCPKCKKRHYSRYGVNYPAPICVDCNEETTLNEA